MFFSFCEVRHVLSILHMRRRIPRACLTLIYWQPMARIMASSEACASVRCAIYTSWGEAAMPHLGLPLPQVYPSLRPIHTGTLFMCCAACTQATNIFFENVRPFRWDCEHTLHCCCNFMQWTKFCQFLHKNKGNILCNSPHIYINYGSSYARRKLIYFTPMTRFV